MFPWVVLKDKKGGQIMMKKRWKLVAVVLALALVMGCVAGCGNKGSEGGTGETDIQISYWNAGLGADWLYTVIDAFNEKYPEYNAYCDASADGAAASAAFGLEDTDTIDLYMTPKPYDTTYMEKLNDVLDTKVNGESKTIKEKFDASYLLQEEYQGDYYSLTYGGGIIGFVYNKALLEKAGITQLPRTTDEFSMVCTALKDKSITPTCHFVYGGYYHWMNEVWFAQYEGIEGYYDFYQNSTKEKMLKKDGRYEVLEVLEKILTPEYVMQGSNSENHTYMQTKFLEGEAAIMLTGSWLASESQNVDNIDNFAMMKTPVISDITDKLTTVKNDKELRNLITAIDNVTDGVETEDTYKDGSDYKVNGKKISAADWAYVKDARNMMALNYAGETCYIPTYSNAKEGAKEFLKFLYSDEGYQIYLDSLNIKMPLSLSEGEVDTSKWNSFFQNQAELMEVVGYPVTNTIMNKHQVFMDGGADSAFGSDDYDFESLLCTNSEADRIDADEAWEYIHSVINDRYDNEWMKNTKK